MKKQMLILVLGVMLVLCSCGAQSVSSSQPQATAAPAGSEPASAVSQAAQTTASPTAAPAQPAQEAVEVPAGGTESTPAQSLEETHPTEQEAPFQEQFKKDAVRELEGLLDEMTPSEDENEAVRQAASLMNWGVGTTLGEDEIASTTKDWLAAQGADRQKQAQLKKVDAAYKKLLGSEGEDLLNRAGCRAMAAYPWSDGEPLETVEAVLNSVQEGAR